MKSIKRILAKIMVIAMLLTLMPITQNVKAVTFEITAPKANKLVGAGHFDIKWTNASGSVKSYKVYLDGKLQGSTSNTSYECYTTEVAIHKAFVVAELNNGSTEKTNTIDFKVTKKGLCVNDEMGRNLNPVFMNMGWYYTWGTTPFTYTTYDQLEFVPMIWGTGSENNISSIASAGYKHLLAYNEPDMDWTVGGSNIDVNTAVSHWSNFTSYNSYYLGAPAPALSPSWDSGTWFRTFMDRIDTSTIDFIPLHCYYGQYGGSAGANAFLTDVVDKTWNMYHKPIWITEFAVSGWGYSNESAKASMKEFMTTVIDGLNKRDYVERYSWFSFNTTDEANGASALWTNSTGELTELGRVYSE